eukprot:1176679-Prorocentrum_minimum.AAC.6
MTSFYVSSCATYDKDALNTPGLRILLNIFNFGRWLNSPVAEWLRKCLTAAWSPTRGERRRAPAWRSPLRWSCGTRGRSRDQECSECSSGTPLKQITPIGQSQTAHHKKPPIGRGRIGECTNQIHRSRQIDGAKSFAVRGAASPPPEGPPARPQAVWTHAFTLSVDPSPLEGPTVSRLPHRSVRKRAKWTHCVHGRVTCVLRVDVREGGVRNDAANTRKPQRDACGEMKHQGNGRTHVSLERRSPLNSRHNY